MEALAYTIGFGIFATAGYLILAMKYRWFPFAVPISVKPNGQQAIIDSLTFETFEVPGRFPLVKSARPLSMEIKEGIKAAFSERIAKAKSLGWTNGFDISGYKINVFPSVRDLDSAGNYSPSFQVFLSPGDPYIGSEYDQGSDGNHWIYAAEQVMTDPGGALTNTFVIADNNSKEYTERVVSYALDHIFAAKNDPELYERTKNHADGGTHPLW